MNSKHGVTTEQPCEYCGAIIELMPANTQVYCGKCGRTTDVQKTESNPPYHHMGDGDWEPVELSGVFTQVKNWFAKWL